MDEGWRRFSTSCPRESRGRLRHVWRCGPWAHGRWVAVALTRGTSGWVGPIRPLETDGMFHVKRRPSTVARDRESMRAACVRTGARGNPK